jgi:hypothetical protein
LVLAWIEDGHFNPRRLAGEADSTMAPEMIARELQSNGMAPPNPLGMP